MASPHSVPFSTTPSPTRTDQQQASITSKPETDARATRSRQLLVPRSMAAKVCAKRPLCQPPLCPACGVESPVMANSFLRPMVHEEEAAGEAAAKLVAAGSLLRAELKRLLFRRA